jgi:hypothetical protein
MILLDTRVSGPVLITASVHDTDTDTVADALRGMTGVHYFGVRKSPIDGSLMVLASLDAKETWPNSIFENSRFFRVSLSLDGKVEWQTFVAGRRDGEWITHKARASRVKTLDAFVEKVRVYALQAAEVVPARREYPPAR